MNTPASKPLPYPIAVLPIEDNVLQITFSNQEIRFFDVKPYLAYPAFTPLQAQDFFKQAHIAHRTVVWNTEVDIAPETLYMESRS